MRARSLKNGGAPRHTGEITISGFPQPRVRQLLHPASKHATKDDLRRLSAKTSRQLRDHGIIRKIPKTHRYQLTGPGRWLTAALFATRNASIEQLLPITP